MSKTKILSAAGAILVLVTLASTGAWDGHIFGIAPAYAQARTLSQTSIETATMLVSMILIVVNFVGWFVLQILHHVIDPQWIFALNPDGSDGALLFMLREIWQFTRDLVNLGFAIALIVGAILMIVTSDGSKIKERMPKFILALVLVNFSWFIPRAIYDFSQVLTYTVYQIPSLLALDGCRLPPGADEVEGPECEIVTNFKLFDKTLTIGADGTDSADGTQGWSCPFGVGVPLVCIQKVRFRDADVAIRNPTRILDGLVVNHARLQWLTQISVMQAAVAPPAGGDAVRQTITFVSLMLGTLVKLVVVLVLNIAIVFPLVAMAAALIIRVPVLWLTMAFMPVVALGFVFDKPAELKEISTMIQDTFLKAVFLPAKVAIPFVVGFIMLNAGAATPPPAEFGVFPDIPLLATVETKWQILWLCISLFMIWKFSFDALRSDKAGVMGTFTDKIQGIGKNLGSVAAQWPMTFPILPVPGHTDASGNQMMISPLRAMQALSLSRMRSELQTLGRVQTPAERLGLNQDHGNITNVIQNSPTTVKITQEWTKTFAGADTTAHNAALVSALNQVRSTHGTNPIIQRATRREIIQQLMNQTTLSEEARKRLEQALKTLPNADQPLGGP